MPSGQTGRAERYLYERLGEKRFQQLVNAVLAWYYSDVVCFPVGQKDGGRDAIRQRDGKPVMIYQVKWAKESIKSPVAWLTSTINVERANIKRLVAEGAQSYVLVTCVAGTSALSTGTMDQLDRKLAGYSTEFGIPVTCWWRADLDARIDSAPLELLWSYSEMLAGHDAVRYLIEADKAESQEETPRGLLLKVIATQWEEDAKVKFRQVELDTYNLLDLFVDVEAVRITRARLDPASAASQAANRNPQARSVPLPPSAQSVPVRLSDLGRANDEPARVGGAAEYLLGTTQPLTLVRGEPGQGKSTLAQYLCQLHRAAFLPNDLYLTGPRPETITEKPRLPLRVDLRDYARWRAGEDPFAEDDTSPARRPRSQPSLEKFLAHLMTARGAGSEVAVEFVNDVISRFPMLIVLDGLDEVAHQDTRTRVVKEINEFAARLGAGTEAPQLIVTTRPNASDLAEPSEDKFETVALLPLSAELRTSYLRKWADARGLRGSARRALEATFRQRSIEPHIEQLADNPMQLTILLFLIQKRGESVPDGRTQLFQAYMDTFLDRESEKSSSVHQHRDDLGEVTAFLGWYLQSNAEIDAAAGRMPTRTIRKAILNYLDDAEKDTSLVGDLFTAVTDRVWALTSKVQGTFEFDIQSMREFFAAAYLWRFAGAELRAFDKSTILGELARRAYWLNTCRFFAGFADPNELSGLVDVLEEELENHTRPMQVRDTAWALLADGVFAGQQRAQKRAARLFVDDLSVRLILHSLTSTERASKDPAQTRAIRPLARDRGAEHLISLLVQRIEAAPGDAVNRERIGLSRLAGGVPAGWWAAHMAAAAGTDHEIAWLRLGAPIRGAAGMNASQLDKLAIDSGEAAELALSAGVKATPGSELERKLIRAVLDGQCSEATLDAVSGTAGDLVQALTPRRFIAKVYKDDWESSAAKTTRALESLNVDRARQQAQRRLRDQEPRFDRIIQAMRTGRGQSGTTAVWGDTAREIAALYGPCWLAAEIAVIGASISDKEWTIGGTITKDAAPFGPRPDYGTLLQEARFARSDPGWWQWHFDAHTDPLSRATWSLALTCIGTAAVVNAMIENLDIAVKSLADDMQRALAHSSSRIGRAGIARELPENLLNRAASLDTLTALLLAHHQHARSKDLGILPDEQVADMARYGDAGWPGLGSLTSRMMRRPSAELVDHLRAFARDTVVVVHHSVAAKVPERLLKTILKDAGAYPLSWVIAAEKALSQKHEEAPLVTAAQAGQWFPAPV